MKEVNSAAFEYIVNKFLPYLTIFVLLFTEFKLYDFQPWVICGLIFFIDKFAFKVGRSVGEYENKPNFQKEVDESLNKED
jgi:hypothetical protein